MGVYFVCDRYYVGGEALMSSSQRRHSHQQEGSVSGRVESIRGQVESNVEARLLACSSDGYCAAMQ